MTTITNALRFLPTARQTGGSATRAPDATTEQSIMFGFVLVSLAGAGAVVLHALSQVVSFQ